MSLSSTWRLALLALAAATLGLAAGCIATARPSPTARPKAPPTRTASGILIGSLPIDLESAHALQAEVDQGHMPWRLKPVEVARVEGEPLGFAPTDSFDLTRQFRDPGTGAEHAVVRAVHGDEIYELQLVQPVRQGEDGIWVIEAVQPAH